MTEQEKDLFIEQLQNELHNSKETVNAQKVVIRQLCAENAKLETEIRKLKQGAENEDAGGNHDEGREGDCEQSNNGGGNEVAHTPLEVALAKKCEKLYDSLATANNERNRFFGLLYGHYIRLGDLKKVFDEKRAKELFNESKKAFEKSVHMNQEASDMMDAVTMNPPYTTPEEVLKAATEKEKEQ